LKKKRPGGGEVAATKRKSHDEMIKIFPMNQNGNNKITATHTQHDDVNIRAEK
jgi:hypothetical protein